MSIFEALIVSLSLMLGLALHSIAHVALFWWVLSGASGKRNKSKPSAPKPLRRSTRIPRQHS